MKPEEIRTWQELFTWAASNGYRLSLNNREWKDSHLVDIKIYKQGMPVGNVINGVSLDDPEAAVSSILDVINDKELYEDVFDSLSKGTAYSLTTEDNWGKQTHHFIQRVPMRDGDAFIVYNSEGGKPEYRKCSVEEMMKTMKHLGDGDLGIWREL